MEQTLSSFPAVVGHASILAVLCVLIIAGNILVLTVIYLDPRLHNPTFYLLANLSVADFLVAVLYIPFYAVAVVQQEWIFGDIWCRGHAAMICLSFNASLMSLCLVSIDRHCSISSPLRYHTIITSRKALWMIIFCWVHSLMWACSPLIGWGDIAYDETTHTCRPDWSTEGPRHKTYFLCLAVFAFALPSIIMVFCYVKIFVTANKQRKHLQHNPSPSIEYAGRRPSVIGRLNIELKAHKTILIIVGAFIFAWLPYAVLTTWKLVTSDKDYPDWLNNMALTFTLVNSCLNPIIYAIRDHRLRSGYRLIMCRCCAESKPEISVSREASYDNSFYLCGISSLENSRIDPERYSSIMMEPSLCPTREEGSFESSDEYSAEHVSYEFTSPEMTSREVSSREDINGIMINKEDMDDLNDLRSLSSTGQQTTAEKLSLKKVVSFDVAHSDDEKTRDES